MEAMEHADKPIRKGKDRYIPIRFEELRRSVAEDLFPAARDQILEAAWLMENLIEFEMGEVEESLKDAYHPFCPDDPSVTRHPKSAEELDDMRPRFLQELAALFEKANYERLNKEEFERAVQAGTTSGLHIVVDLDRYADFYIYFRGLGKKTRKVRSWKTRFRATDVEIPIYLRSAIVTRLAGENVILLKLFKDIPVHDIESLLPETTVKMRILDKMKITSAGGAAVYSGLKAAFKYALLVGKGFLWPLVLLLGSAYLGRTVFRFFKIRDTYRKNLIRDLFYQNLDNNLGVINRIVDATEEEECKEAFLAYAFALAADAPPAPKALQESIQDYLRRGWKVEPVFDLDDALSKLESLGLAQCAEDRVEPVPLARALEILDASWDSLYEAGKGKGRGIVSG